MRKPPYRIWIGAMIFWSSTQTYVFLGHFQISILAMIAFNQTEIPQERQATLQADYGPRYSWSKAEEGLLIGAYFYGNTLMSLPGGILCDYFGPFKIILTVTFLSAVTTCIAVPLTGENWVPLFICRFFIGCFGSIKIPALNGLIAKWSPPNERGTFTSCLLGCVFGTMIAPPCSSFVVQYFGWPWSFYGISMGAILFSVVWFLMVSDFPLENWFCPKDEAEYIQSSLKGAVRKGWIKPPFLQMLTSIPLVMSVIGQVGMVSGFVAICALLPKFLTEALHFDLTKVGIVAMLPNTARLICGFFCSILVQILLQRQKVTKKMIRKGFVVFSHFIPGIMLCLFLLSYAVEFSDEVVVSMIVILNAFASASVVTTSVNQLDLAPNYASTQNGIMSLFAYMPGFAYPSLVAKITEEKSDLPTWSIIFAMIGILYIVTGLIFVVFGSTELQPWNESGMPQEDEVDPNLAV